MMLLWSGQLGAMTGCDFQISVLYCSMVRSLEKGPDMAMFMSAFLAQPLRSLYASLTASWHRT